MHRAGCCKRFVSAEARFQSATVRLALMLSLGVAKYLMRRNSRELLRLLCVLGAASCNVRARTTSDLG